MTSNETIDLRTAASLDRQTLIKATALLMTVAAKDNAEVRREIIGLINADGELDAWKDAFEAYPDVM
ncbi:hypothetical protein AAD018_009020 [Aestuariibius insulae]|uniref:hypothetical protein n=1 Tax=Aestuariibius insulae TaxID=2058287 RepID=UPI00345E96FD